MQLEGCSYTHIHVLTYAEVINKIRTGRTTTLWRLGVVGAETTPHGWSETKTSQLWASHAHGQRGESVLPILAVIATWRSVRPGITSPMCVQFLSFTTYLLERASAPPVRTESPRSTGLELRCASATAANALAVSLMRIGQERLDLGAENTHEDDARHQCRESLSRSLEENHSPMPAVLRRAHPSASVIPQRRDHSRIKAAPTQPGWQEQ